jgi:hypothetical protein
VTFILPGMQFLAGIQSLSVRDEIPTSNPGPRQHRSKLTKPLPTTGRAFERSILDSALSKRLPDVVPVTTCGVGLSALVASYARSDKISDVY